MIEVRNPRSGQIDHRFEPTSARTLTQSVAALRAAQPAWRGLGIEGRVAALTGFSAALARHADALTAALVADTGRIPESRMEIDAVCGAIDHWCATAPELLAPPPPAATRVPFVTAHLGHTPYEVAGIIAPWNFPLLLSFIDAIPALLAGCAVALKPSEVTPRFVAPLREALSEVAALASVLAPLPGGGALGEALIGEVDVVCFTGSVATGRRVAQTAARHFVPAHLELGGKDPAIVFADADPERAAAAICWSATANAGQSCLSIERVYVERPLHDAFVTALTRQMAALELNREDPNRGQIGPVISADQIGIVERHLADALERGARAECGGRLVHDGGTWCEPTVLCDVDHDMLIMREETFAPIAPVMAFDDETQAVALANDTRYGLSAAVFTDDAARLRRVAAALEAGAVSGNDAGLTAFIHEGAKQAFKDSGLGGSRMGPTALSRFYRATVLLENVDQAWDPWWHEPPGGGRV